MEKQSDHRMAMERKALTGEQHRSGAGLFCACLLGFAVIGAGVYAISLHHAGAGATIITAVLGSGLGVFMYGSRQRRQDLAKKSEIQNKLARSK